MHKASTGTVGIPPSEVTEKAPDLDTGSPGVHRVHATLYECLLPQGRMPTAGPVVGGVETAPAGSLYFRRVELEKTVEVRGR